ncbi:adenylyltransferase/cytidyltransferase family protein [Candidatus Bathyarchaeota archaeon]|nr:adenylyltransferase/cytidyltransferase family protein [Candidatus Bathyarchaeota archaeon]
MTTVLASGVFDLLHYGHIRFLEEAKKKGGKDSRLVVIVARDETVHRLKGSDPVIPEDQRRAIVDSLEMVDEALLGFEDLDLTRVIQQLKPDLIAVGHDQEYICDQLIKIKKALEMDFDIIRIERFGKEDLNSSSKIKRRIVEGARTRG